MLRLVLVLAFLVIRPFVSGRFVSRASSMVLVTLLGSVRAVEFMALAGNPEKGNGQQKDRE